MFFWFVQNKTFQKKHTTIKIRKFIFKKIYGFFYKIFIYMKFYVFIVVFCVFFKQSITKNI